MARPGFPVPKDIVPSGCGLRGQIRCVFYGDTMDEVKEKRVKYLAEYPPQGYGTESSSINKHTDGYYVITITRWASCD